MKKLFLFACLFLLLIFVTDDVAAQPFKKRNLPTPPDNPTDVQQTTSVPIDGGLGILLAAGVGYGLKRYRQEKKKRTIAEHD